MESSGNINESSRDHHKEAGSKPQKSVKIDVQTVLSQARWDENCTISSQMWWSNTHRIRNSLWGMQVHWVSLLQEIQCNLGLLVLDRGNSGPLWKFEETSSWFTDLRSIGCKPIQQLHIWYYDHVWDYRLDHIGDIACGRYDEIKIDCDHAGQTTAKMMLMAAVGGSLSMLRRMHSSQAIHEASSERCVWTWMITDAFASTIVMRWSCSILLCLVSYLIHYRYNLIYTY